MSWELFVVIFFGTLSCVLGLLQLWMAFHQYWFWVRHLRNQGIVTLQNLNEVSTQARDYELHQRTVLSPVSLMHRSFLK